MLKFLYTRDKGKITIRVRVSYHRFYEGEVAVVWVHKDSTTPSNIQKTIKFLENHFKKYALVVVSVGDKGKPVFLSKTKFAEKFSKFSFNDFTWVNKHLDIDDHEHKVIGLKG